MSAKRKAIKSVFSNWIGYSFKAVISFIATPVIVLSLGKADYGIWSIVASMTGYYGLLNFGIRSALTKFIAEFNAKKDFGEVNALLNSSFLFFMVIASFILAIAGVLAIYFDRIFIIEDVDILVIRQVVFLIGVNTAISFMFQPFDAVLVSLNRFDIVNTIGVISSVLRTTLIIIILKTGYGLLGMAVIILIVDFLTFSVSAFYAKKIMPSLSVKFAYFKMSTVKKLFRFGLFNFMIHISRVILERADTMIIAIFLGPVSVTLYSIAESLNRYVWVIVKAISRVTLPLSSELNALDQVERVKKIMMVVPKYMLPVSMFIGMEFFFLGDQFILLWMGDGFHQSFVIFCVLFIARVGMMTHETLIQSVIGMGKNRFFGWLSIGEMAANVVLSLYLVKIMGVIGVALGTVIPLTITRSFIVPLFCYRTVEVSLGSYFSGIVVPAVVSLVPCTLVQYYLSSRFIPDTYTMLFTQGAVSAMVLMLFFYRYLEPELKTLLKRRVGLA